MIHRTSFLRRAPEWIIACLVAVVIIFVVSPLLMGERYAFRDISHFYLPLYDYVAERTRTEWLPWWNPLDQAGMPLIGETSTAVLYPIRYLIYSLPLGSEHSMNAYLLFHIGLSATTAWWCARQMGCSFAGRAIASLSYSLSGSVFSLCCNPPFLVGAAWLPLGLAACLSDLPLANSYRIRMLSLALAMMILGGDPQSALHCVLVVSSIFAWRTFVSCKDWRCLYRIGWPSFRLVLGGMLMASAMASMQIAASLDWSRQSERVASDSRPDQYDFSLAPWHIAELLTARPFGKPFVHNAIISKTLPGEGRMWTPTVYAGAMVAIALVLGLLTCWHGKDADRMWLAIASLAMMLCWGQFGLVWWLQQLPGVLPNAWSAIGGPYWFLNTLFPGYDSFRYPVKWLPVFSIACSMIAGRWVCTSSTKFERRVILAMASASAIAAVLVSLVFQLPTENPALTADEYWGPVDVTSAAQIIALSLAESAVLFLLIAAIRTQFTPKRAPRRVAFATICVVVLCGVDVGRSAYDLLPRVDVNRELAIRNQLKNIESVMPADRQLDTSSRSLRTQSKPWPKIWKSKNSVDRAMEVAVSERVSWFGRWHLADRKAVFNSMVSIRSRFVGQFWNQVNQTLDGKPAETRQKHWRLIRRWLGLDGVIHIDGRVAVDHDGMQLVKAVQVKDAESSFFRIQRRWREEEKIESILKRMIETGELPIASLDVAPSTDSIHTKSELQIQDSLNAIVRCDHPVVLERCQLQEGNWHARIISLIDDRTVPRIVHRCSVLNQAVVVPKGDWRVEFYYRPWWYEAMTLLTLASWFLIVLPWNRLMGFLRCC